MKENVTKRNERGPDIVADKALTDLIRISNLVGKDPALVQGGGGNTSVKTADGKYMFIKASGTALKDMNATQGWRQNVSRFRPDHHPGPVDHEAPDADAGSRGGQPAVARV